MSDKFSLIPVDRLLKIILQELKSKQSIFGIPEANLVKAEEHTRFQSHIFNQMLDFPLGVAAGPHTQLAQNIVSSWLCGARYIELKTIQTLDELEVLKPCIDMQDEGYNCEWSQELKIKNSFDQYLDAWIILHVLNYKLYGKKTLSGTVFNMSVGYNLEGILNENVQWFFEKMQHCEAEKNQKIDQLKSVFPEIVQLDIPSQISDNITLSTMHGCPSDEIEKIGHYLLVEKKLKTYIKLNPTLLGAIELRELLNSKMGFRTEVPDLAFEHDLKYPDAIKIIESLEKTAQEQKLEFGLKLTNTLESLNNKSVFGEEAEMMYMSGRALHPISVNVARKLQNEFKGRLKVSFAGGADCFNFPDLIAAGLGPVTVSSDILKPGGYGRLTQYIEELGTRFDQVGALNINELILKSGVKTTSLADAKLENLNQYADRVKISDDYKKKGFSDPNIKGTRKLDYFDCIDAPCRENCATHQDIPDYLHYTSKGDYNKAFEEILKTNPQPAITGNICDHLCQLRCTRINYDQPLLIREIKRFVEENHTNSGHPVPKNRIDKKVAIIGAGPSGLSCAYYLGLNGFLVEIFEEKPKAGGMVSGAVPSFRLDDEKINNDVKRVTDLGVQVHYNAPVDTELFEKLHHDFDYVYIATGAKLSAKTDIPGIDAQGVIEPLNFLFNVRLGKPNGVGKNIAIIGGGNTAMDAARVAWRLVGEQGKVTIVYRRTIKEMPADLGEIEAVLEEGVEIMELVSPEEVLMKDQRVIGLRCTKNQLISTKPGERPKPVTIENSMFDLNFDTIIPAIGQETEIKFIDPELFKPHPNTYEIRLKQVYTGGDAMRGAATAIKAIGDGRKVAEQIVAQSNLEKNELPKTKKTINYADLMLLKSRRVKSVAVKETSISDRRNFNPVSFTLDKESAQKEASRCLQCDLLCNICVTVCPNRANYSYQIKPVEYQLQKAVRVGEKVEIQSDTVFKVDQQYQILNLADFCNECGNCTAFCPTAGMPYRDKPRFYLTIKSFNEVDEGYFLSCLPQKDILIYKEKGGIRTLEKENGQWIYETDHVKATFLEDTFELLNVVFKVPCANQVHFRMAAEMSLLYHAAIDWYPGL